MGKRKKSEPESQPPIKMVIGLSPDRKKSQDKQQYAILNQSGADDSSKMRSKRKASNIDPKKWQEKSDEEDDDDIEVLEVYKAPKVARKHPRVPPGASLIMDCLEEDLSKAQRTALKRVNGLRDDVLKRIAAIKKQYGENCIKVEQSEEYLGPESVKVIEKPRPPNTPRPKSPDLIMVDAPAKTQAPVIQSQPQPAHPIATVPAPNMPNILSMFQGAQIRPGMPALPLGSGIKAQIQGSNMVLLGTNDQPLQIIPHQLLSQGNQSIVLRTGGKQQFHMVNTGQPRPQAMYGNLVPPQPIRMSAPMQMNAPVPMSMQPVSGTKGLGIKRTAVPTVISNDIQGPQPKKTRGRYRKQAILPVPVPQEETDNVNWVPLDEYYYSKKEGDPAYREQKGEYRFKCWYCCKMLYNNLRIMMHIQGHIDSEKQQNLDLSDLTQCKHCYKQFDTPFEMQCHVEKVHQKQSNVLVCRICEKDHTSQVDLKLHMRVHNTCEMPYICQLCNFRSSVYNDVVDHFKKRHDSSCYMLCLYCLKTFETKFAKSAGWGMTQVYYQHLVKHQTKGTNKKCSWCKLAFINKSDLLLHKGKDHLPNYRGILGGNTGSTLNDKSEQVMIRVPDSQNQAPSKGKLKSLNAPVNKLAAFANVKYHGVSRGSRCIECKSVMDSLDHYKKYTECSMCRFATTCNEAYANHMSGFHSRGVMSHCTRDRPLPKKMFCLCGFSSVYGNKIANHLIFCSKRTCYAEKPEVRYFEYDDEQEEYNPFEPYCEEPDTPEVDEGTPERDIPSLFGALGLVKKPPCRLHSRPCSKESSPFREPPPTQVVRDIFDNVLDDMFPAEAAADEFVGTLLSNVFDVIDDRRGKKFRSAHQIAIRRASSETASQMSASTEQTASRQSSVDDIPPELKGKQKWDTVKIHHEESPTKSSIFIGSSDLMGDESPEDSNVSAPSSERSNQQHSDENPGSTVPESPETVKPSPEKTSTDIDRYSEDGSTQMDVDEIIPADESEENTRETYLPQQMSNADSSVTQTDDQSSESHASQSVSSISENVEDHSQRTQTDVTESEAPQPDHRQSVDPLEPLEADTADDTNSKDEDEDQAVSQVTPEMLEVAKDSDLQADGDTLEHPQPSVAQSPDDTQTAATDICEQMDTQDVEPSTQDVESEKVNLDRSESQDDVEINAVMEERQCSVEPEGTSDVEQQPLSGQEPSQSVSGMEERQCSVETEGTSDREQQQLSDQNPAHSVAEMETCHEKDEQSQNYSKTTTPGSTTESVSDKLDISPPGSFDINKSDLNTPDVGQTANKTEANPLVAKETVVETVAGPLSTSGSTARREQEEHQDREIKDKRASDRHDHRSHDRHGNDRYGDRNYNDRDRDRNRDYDRNRDRYHDNRHQGSKDYNRPNDRDRYGGHSHHRQDDRHGNHPYKQGHRGGYHNDRRDNRGGYRGGRGGYYGNQGYY